MFLLTKIRDFFSPLKLSCLEFQKIHNELEKFASVIYMTHHLLQSLLTMIKDESLFQQIDGWNQIGFSCEAAGELIK